MICPLDWGLGHATRCVPVIKEIQKSCEVVIAGSGDSLELLKQEFPGRKFYEISPYGITYSKRVSFMLTMAWQAPRLLSAIRKEYKQVSDIVGKEKIDFIISDNRYGCYHKTIPSAIIIHQLSLIAPGIATYYNQKLIKRFNECWVPDTPDHRLSGTLSVNKNIHAKFIGPLSRMTQIAQLAALEGPAPELAAPVAHGPELAALEAHAPELAADEAHGPELAALVTPASVPGPRSTSHNPHSPHILALISGPEPHRSSFESLLSRELPNSGLSYKIVRGLPNEKTERPGHFINHLPASELARLISSAEVVISRSGYSTIMDLAALKKKAIFVPTPGQTEQLYLARELERKKIAPMYAQEDLSLPAAMERLKQFSGFKDDYFDDALLKNTLREFLG